MKVAIFILGLSLIAVVNASVFIPDIPDKPDDFEEQVMEILKEAEAAYNEAEATIRAQIEQSHEEHTKQVDEAVKAIEDRKFENEECYAAHEPTIIATVEEATHGAFVCGLMATNEAVLIVDDFGKAIYQIIYDGYNMVAYYEKCGTYSGAWMQTLCYTNATVKLGIYINNSRKSIEEMINICNVRGPAIAPNYDNCVGKTTDAALMKLNAVQDALDSCIAEA